MQRATERGVDLTVWLSAQQTQIFSGDSRYSLTISTNPFEPFLMGHWFQTCLSITHTGGFNSWSVFANAADANKLLLVLRDDRGNIVGRKLLAISKAWELIPFRTYLRLDNEDLRRNLERAIDEECLRLAARMGLRIGQRADIEPLHGWDWYDDGPVAAEGPAARPRCLLPSLESTIRLPSWMRQRSRSSSFPAPSIHSIRQPWSDTQTPQQIRPNDRRRDSGG